MLNRRYYERRNNFKKNYKISCKISIENIESVDLSVVITAHRKNENGSLDLGMFKDVGEENLERVEIDLEFNEESGIIYPD